MRGPKHRQATSAPGRRKDGGNAPTGRTSRRKREGEQRWVALVTACEALDDPGPAALSRQKVRICERLLRSFRRQRRLVAEDIPEARYEGAGKNRNQHQYAQTRPGTWRPRCHRRLSTPGRDEGTPSCRSTPTATSSSRRAAGCRAARPAGRSEPQAVIRQHPQHREHHAAGTTPLTSLKPSPASAEVTGGAPPPMTTD